LYQYKWQQYHRYVFVKLYQHKKQDFDFVACPLTPTLIAFPTTTTST